MQQECSDVSAVYPYEHTSSYRHEHTGSYSLEQTGSHPHEHTGPWNNRASVQVMIQVASRTVAIVNLLTGTLSFFCLFFFFFFSFLQYVQVNTDFSTG